MTEKKDAFIHTEHNVVKQGASKLKGMALESLIKWCFDKTEKNNSLLKEKQIQSILSELFHYSKNIFKVTKKFALITVNDVFHNFNPKPIKNDDIIFDVNLYKEQYKIFYHIGSKKCVNPLKNIDDVKDFLLKNGFIEFLNLSESSLKKRLDLVRIVDDRLIIYESKNYEKSSVGLNELVQVLLYSLAFKRCGINHQKVDLIFNGNVQKNAFTICGLWYHKYNVFIEIVGIKKLLLYVYEKTGIVINKLFILPKNLGVGEVLRCGASSDYYFHIIYSIVRNLKYYHSINLYILEDTTLKDMNKDNIALVVIRVYPVKKIKNYIITDMILSDGKNDVFFSYFGDDKTFSPNDIIYLKNAYLKNYEGKKQIAVRKEGEVILL